MLLESVSYRLILTRRKRHFMPTILHTYDTIKEQLRDKLTYYLQSQGIHITEGKPFSCINPEHDDSSPSCGIVPESHGHIFHCFGCGATGDIFTATSFLEGKPLTGISFIHDNLKYLADIYGIELPIEEPNPEEQYEMDTYRAYRDAAQIIIGPKNNTYSPIVEAALKKYGWEKNIRISLGVGSVTSHEDFMNRMKKQHGWSESFLTQVDLHRKSMFSENNLIFTVKDENGNPVGFACRNLLFEQQTKDYTDSKAKILEKYAEDNPKRKEALDKLKKPTKYINSMEHSSGETSLRNHIYQKSKRLFGLHRAKKFATSLYVFEGYSDCVTAVNAGLQNSCAIGSTSFTKDHLELILGLGIKHIIFVLDADDAGEAGTDRFVKLLGESLGGRPGLRVEIVAMPDGTDDPDAYIRTMGGLKAFQALPKTDIFGWSLHKAMAAGQDPILLANDMVGYIVNETNNFIRLQKSRQLAKETGIPEDVIWREVTALVDSDVAKMEEEKAIVAATVAKKLQLNPKAIHSILQEAQDRIDKIQSSKETYSVVNTKKTIESIKTTQVANIELVELKTGWELFDTLVGGIPKEDSFVTIPGKMNQGKSSFLANLAWRIIDNNPDTMVLYHTIDDSLSVFLPRLWASKFGEEGHLKRKDGTIWDTFDPIADGNNGHKTGWYSNDFKKAGYSLANYSNFHKAYKLISDWTDNVIEKELLVPEDISSLPPTFPSLESRIKTLRHKYPDRGLVVIGDNFHLYDLPGEKEGESKTRAMSVYAKHLANKYHATLIMTMELTKAVLRPGVRPKVRNLKGSAGMSYDSSLNIGVYNDLKDREGNANIIAVKDGIVDPNTTKIPYRKPVIELVLDKSKVGSFDSRLYYELEPRSGRVEECSIMEQNELRIKADEYTNKWSDNGDDMGKAMSPLG